MRNFFVFLALLVTGCTEMKSGLLELSEKIDRVLEVEQEKDQQPPKFRSQEIYEAALAKQARGQHTEAFSLLQSSAKMGHAGAAYELGQAYTKGVGVLQNLDQGARWINTAAERGDDRAQFLIGAAYFSGEGVQKDYGRAADYLSRAATKGHARAQYLLAKCFANGLGVSRDPAWAARWYGKAAHQGHTDAQFAYGVVWAAGLGRRKNLERGYRWLTIAALAGNARADELRGKLGRSLDETMRLRAESDAKSFKARKNPRFEDEPTVGYAQESLNRLGYDAGDVDGVMGPKTRKAIRSFQRANKLTPDGRLGPNSLEKLLKESRDHG